MSSSEPTTAGERAESPVMTLVRYLVAAAFASAVTFGLVLLMNQLIASGNLDLRDAQRGRIVDFVRLKRESEIQKKRRELPQPEKLEQPEPPDLDLSDMPPPDLGKLGGLGAGSFSPELDLGGGPALGAAPSDTDVVPLVRVNPQYPSRAMMANVEGWVHLEFTITPAGTVKDARVLDADPPGYFERASLNAVRKYKYKPKIEDGVPVERPGVQVVLSFKLSGK